MEIRRLPRRARHKKSAQGSVIAPGTRVRIGEAPNAIDVAEVDLISRRTLAFNLQPARR